LKPVHVSADLSNEATVQRPQLKAILVNVYGPHEAVGVHRREPHYLFVPVTAERWIYCTERVSQPAIRVDYLKWKSNALRAGYVCGHHDAAILQHMRRLHICARRVETSHVTKVRIEHAEATGCPIEDPNRIAGPFHHPRSGFEFTRSLSRATVGALEGAGR
jgi:hypothetical protein